MRERRGGQLWLSRCPWTTVPMSPCQLTQQASAEEPQEGCSCLRGRLKAPRREALPPRRIRRWKTLRRCQPGALNGAGCCKEAEERVSRLRRLEPAEAGCYLHPGACNRKVLRVSNMELRLLRLALGRLPHSRGRNRCTQPSLTFGQGREASGAVLGGIADISEGRFDLPHLPNSVQREQRITEVGVSCSLYRKKDPRENLSGRLRPTFETLLVGTRSRDWLIQRADQVGLNQAVEISPSGVSSCPASVGLYGIIPSPPQALLPSGSKTQIVQVFPTPVLASMKGPRERGSTALPFPAGVHLPVLLRQGFFPKFAQVHLGLQGHLQGPAVGHLQVDPKPCGAKRDKRESGSDLCPHPPLNPPLGRIASQPGGGRGTGGEREGRDSRL
ncbi:methionine-R-sulfoxide reductase B1 isoform X3 [Paroedura picta]|uniref:methionine-R-sulfoxide reductase B1 isoform X3 n=1 Tax=Paroedura picta TaxID=143630 RepID=UPI004056E4C3